MRAQKKSRVNLIFEFSVAVHSPSSVAEIDGGSGHSQRRWCMSMIMRHASFMPNVCVRAVLKITRITSTVCEWTKSVRDYE